MKNCLHCIHAQWDKTANGRLHPSGDGRCTKEVAIPPLPQSKYWLSFDKPITGGGGINRRKEIKDHCVYWADR